MSQPKEMAGWSLPEDVVVSKKEFVPGQITIAKDSEAIVSPVFEDREAAFEWLKETVDFMNGNAILELDHSPLNDNNEHWFSGRAALIGERVTMSTSEEAKESRMQARLRRQKFYEEQMRAQQDRDDKKAQLAEWEANRSRRNAWMLRTAAVLGTLTVGSGLVYALPM